MKKLFFSIIIAIAVLHSCKKNIEAEPESSTEALSDIAFPVPPYTWSSLPVPNSPSYPGNDPKIQNFTAYINNAWWAFSGDCLRHAYKLNTSTMKWELYRDYGVGFCLFSDALYLFSHGSKMYYGFIGYEAYTFKSFDPVTGTSTTLANMPVNAMDGSARCFVIGDNAYIYLEGVEDQFYRYNIPGNTWTSLGNSPNGKRHGATVVVMGDKVYMGMGWESTGSGRSYKRDWKTITIGSSWATVKANFPGDLRNNAEHFVINDNIYVGFGSHYSPNNNPVTTLYRDLWKYNTNSNAWSRSTDFPGTRVPGKVSQYGNLSAFAKGNAGFVLTGGMNEFWRYANTPLITTTN